MSTTYTALATATQAQHTATEIGDAGVRRRSSAIRIPPSQVLELEIEEVDEQDLEILPEKRQHHSNKKCYKKLRQAKFNDNDCDVEEAGDVNELLESDDSSARAVNTILAALQLVDYARVWRKYPYFRAYLISHLCQHIGDWFVRIASLLLVQELSSKGKALGNLVLAVKLPMAIFGHVGGYLADRYDRRGLMIALDILAGISVLGYLVALAQKSLKLVYAMTVVRSIISAIYYPITTSIVPLIVPDNKHDLQFAVTMNSWAWSCMAVVGGIAAGGATAVIGLQACFILDSVTFFASASVVYYGIQGNYNINFKTKANHRRGIGANADTSVQQQQPQIESTKSGYDAATQQVLTYLTTCGFGLLVLMKPSASLVWGPEDVIGSLFATVRDAATGEEIEGITSVRTGLLFSTIGVACWIGPTLSNYFTDATRPHTLQRSSIIGLCLLTTGWYLISLAPNYAWFLACTLVRSMGSGIVWTSSTLTLQAMVDPEILGRVLGIEYMFYTLCEAASATLAGLLDDAGFSTQILAFFGAVMGTAVCTLWGVYHWNYCGAANLRLNPKQVAPHEDPGTLSLELPPMD